MKPYKLYIIKNLTLNKYLGIDLEFTKYLNESLVDNLSEMRYILKDLKNEYNYLGHKFSNCDFKYKIVQIEIKEVK